MDSFDTTKMAYILSPLPSNAMHHLDYMSVESGMDGQDQYSNFDSETYMRYSAV